MGKKYQIWDKTSDVYTPSGEVFTPQEWIERYQWVNNPNTHMIISAGTLNGSLCYEYWQTIEQYRGRGCDIPDSVTGDPNAVIDLIEAFEENEQQEQREMAEIPSAEERIASAIEESNMLMMAQMMDAE